MALKTSPSNYLLERKLLPPFIGPFSLGGFIIGCTVSSLFFGWQTGLSFGWGNMAVALVLSTIMHAVLLISVSEMCTALPFTSGLSTFAQAAFNPEMFAFSGALHAISFITFPAILLLTLGDTLCVIFLKLSYGLSVRAVIIYVLPAPALTMILHYRPKILFRVILALSVYCMMLMATYIAIVLFIKPPQMSTVMAESQVAIDFPRLSFVGIIRAFPFACYFYMGIESFPSTSEEAKKIFRVAPKVAKWSLTILVIIAFTLLVTFPNRSAQDSLFFRQATFDPCTSKTTSTDSPPIPNHNPSPKFFQSKYMMLDIALSLVCSRLDPQPDWCHNSSRLSNNQNPVISVLVALTVFPPFFLSLITATYVSARHIYFLSRSGILPVSISHTHSGAPILATCASLALAIFTIGLIYALNEIPFIMEPMLSPVFGISSNTVPNQASINQNIVYPRFRTQSSYMLVLAYFWVSCLTYVVKFATYVALHVRVPNLPRPFVSPFGIVGAYVGLVICLGFGVIGPFLLGPLFYGALLVLGAVFTIIGALYWVFVAKIRVANSPEKIFIRHQLKQLWGRSYSIRPSPYPARNQQQNEHSQSTNACSTTMPVNSIVIPNPISARLAVLRNQPNGMESYSAHACSTTVLVNSGGMTGPGLEI